MLNKDLYKIEQENAFSKSTRMVKEYKAKHPEANIVSLGIGDVSRPIVRPVVEAMKLACEDLASMEHFQGYGAHLGIESLRKAILEKYYKQYDFSYDEIYVGCGTKTDSTSILELFDKDAKVLIGNPTYPIYLNGSLALSRNVIPGRVDEKFKLIVPQDKYDIIYICSPCNPIGNAYTCDELKKWVDYCNANKSILLYDNVYRSFVESKDVPNSIYDIEGSKSCAIELRSFSKDASFSGMRCSYYVIPKEIYPDINFLWSERTTNRFNGASYVAQKGAEASLKDDAQVLIMENIKYYKDNAHYLRNELKRLGYEVIGGIDAPYLWVKAKNGMDAWQAFKFFLEELNVVVVPGLVFGSHGKYHIRISALGSKESCIEAIKRIEKYEEKN